MVDKTNIASSSRNPGRISMNLSISDACSMFPGFKFSPTDEELIQYYLRKKLQGSEPRSIEVIPEIDIYKHEPWDLPDHAIIRSDCEWFFFSHRGRKYPNGSQSRRATEAGYWKATGKERDVKWGLNLIGTKRTLVFHLGRAPTAQRTEWLMQEYTTNDKIGEGMVVCRIRRNKDFHLHDTSKKKNRAASGSGNSDVPETNYLLDSGSSFSVDKTETSSIQSDKRVGDCEQKGGDDTSDEDKGANNDNDDAIHESNNNKILPPPKSIKLDKNDAANNDCYGDIMPHDIVKLDENVGFGVLIKPDYEFTPVAEDNCYDDITMTDDTFRLDEYAEPISDMGGLIPSPKLNYPSEEEEGLIEPNTQMSRHPFQGTAHRRLRLQKERPKVHQGPHKLPSGIAKIPREIFGPVSGFLMSESTKVLLQTSIYDFRLRMIRSAAF
ncbi:NAC domain-containing protein 89 [Striga hermonthica]|uniref:NAC domain-containing protein 89 n=1 Tax=Striga hermonthica TaxID=68872 RepID=A0A9N7N9W4_STRHE|nr:NAC domain-containing protein 89 [Striga hermonthica]